MPNLNPKILQWARETAGLDLAQAARKIGIKPAYGIDAPDRLAALETGEAAPTRPTLEKMAKQYRRPLTVFYLPDIPPRATMAKTSAASPTLSARPASASPTPSCATSRPAKSSSKRAWNPRRKPRRCPLSTL